MIDRLELPGTLLLLSLLDKLLDSLLSEAFSFAAFVVVNLTVSCY